jgi:chaperonin GroES
MNFQPLGERVLVKVKEPETTTASGIIIPDNASKDKPNEAEVTAIGPEVKHVEVGNKVMFSKFARSAEVTIDGVDYLVMEVSEILGVMK